MTAVRAVLGAGLALALVAGGAGDDEPGDRLRDVGHPRDRFPLTVYVAAAPEATWAKSLERALGDWKAVVMEALGVVAFERSERQEGSDVVVRFVPRTAATPAGAAQVDHDDLGVIELPVQIDLAVPPDRWSDAYLFGVVAHELGHAIGLPHTDDVASIMCCTRTTPLERGDLRERYLAARRNPDVRSVLRQLRELYPRFWRP